MAWRTSSGGPSGESSSFTSEGSHAIGFSVAELVSRSIGASLIIARTCLVMAGRLVLYGLPLSRYFPAPVCFFRHLPLYYTCTSAGGQLFRCHDCNARAKACQGS